jgi:hypothetical protein
MQLRQLAALAAVVCVEAFAPAALDAKSRPSFASAQMCTTSNFAPLGLRRSLPPRVKSLLNLLQALSKETILLNLLQHQCTGSTRA